MTPSTRQAGAVHIMFLIITLVVAIAGWALWFTEFSDNEAKTKAATDAKAALDVATNREVMLRSAYEEVATAVGATVPAKMPPIEDGDDVSTYLKKIREQAVAPIQRKVNEARTVFAGDESMVTLDAIDAPAEAMVNGLRTEIASLKSEIETLKGAKSTAERANDDMVTTHNTELSGKNDALNQLREGNAAKEQLLESQKDALQGDLSATTDKYEALLTSSNEEITALKNATNSFEREVRSFKTEIRTKRERNIPDGNVTGVSLGAATCYIDLGSKHGLRRGTRFNTYSLAKGRVKEYHGYIVVTDVELGRALCSLEDGAKPERGDFITSPIFERDGAMTFYFLGNLPGRFTNQQAKAILEQYGMKVVDDFSIFVDFVVLGANPDPEAIGDDANPNWFKETEAYNDAIRWGTEMLRAQDLESYLKY
ncbi:MAG: hypothetical protein H6807_12810 [Planctomycetes bacterium]|nr:hypothetical protein [Planctomycetota bacterium]